VSDPVLCKPPYGVLEDKCPTLAVVKHNFAHGWKAVHRRIDHTQAIVGDCDASEAIKFKQYHQCLATLSHCLQFTSYMPSRQCQNYYRCLLRGIKAEPNLSSKSYAALLNKDAVTNGGALAIEDGLADDAIPIDDLPHIGLWTMVMAFSFHSLSVIFRHLSWSARVCPELALWLLVIQAALEPHPFKLLLLRVVMAMLQETLEQLMVRLMMGLSLIVLVLKVKTTCCSLQLAVITEVSNQRQIMCGFHLSMASKWHSGHM